MSKGELGEGTCRQLADDSLLSETADRKHGALWTLAAGNAAMSRSKSAGIQVRRELKIARPCPKLTLLARLAGTLELMR